MKPIAWTPELAADIDTRSLRIYREQALKKRREAEAVISHMTPPERYASSIALFTADVEEADAIIDIIEDELTSRGMPFE